MHAYNVRSVCYVWFLPDAAAAPDLWNVRPWAPGSRMPAENLKRKNDVFKR
ncbi:hypothetical protein NGR_c19910 [Sinorhizobium fredii NGR234]|uniref:Uncharacterized protein n=1 Tax=Sinorhizobium fredii (strain NBRC 101917 / NGR234) TaxID=394 RepID=C3ME85_SINFN|nr:hypothetical protein NGR_c19910 [Sinorhizobium fredii NGR234]